MSDQVRTQIVGYLTHRLNFLFSTRKRDAIGITHCYHSDESTFILGASDVILNFYSLLQASRIATDETPHSAASHLGLYCLPMSHKETTRLIIKSSRNISPSRCFANNSRKQNHAHHKFFHLVNIVSWIFPLNMVLGLY